MEGAILWSGTALVVFSLWAISRHDVVRIMRASVKVKARVAGYRTIWEDGQKSYSARFAFDVDGHRVEVIDQMLNSTPRPSLGSEVWLHYPRGRPDLARIARPATWAFVYLALGAMLAIMIFEMRRRLN
jgi:hypothetical protein